MTSFYLVLKILCKLNINFVQDIVLLESPNELKHADLIVVYQPYKGQKYCQLAYPTKVKRIEFQSKKAWSQRIDLNRTTPYGVRPNVLQRTVGDIVFAADMVILSAPAFVARLFRSHWTIRVQALLLELFWAEFVVLFIHNGCLI